MKIFQYFLGILISSLFITTSTSAQTPTTPISPSSSYFVGSFYMPNWKIGTQSDAWTTLSWFPDRKPLLGYYDEGDPAVMDWEIKWAKEHGINFFIFDWLRCGGDTNSSCNTQLGQPISDQNVFLGHALNNAFLNSSHKNTMNFSLMLTSNYPWTQNFSSIDDLKNNLMPYLINKYLKLPNYLKVDGRPILFIHNIHDLSKMLGSDASQVKLVVPTIKQAIKDAGLGDAIVLGENNHYVVRDLQYINLLKEYGFDYNFSYMTSVHLPSTRPTNNQAVTSQKESYEYLLANSPLPFLLTASPMWDSTPIRLSQYPLYEPKWKLTGPEYAQVLQNAVSVSKKIDPKLLGNRMILVDAWNEYSEGHYIAPTQGSQFDYLKAIRNILTNADNNPDYTLPNPTQLNSMSRLYQAYLSHVHSPLSFFKDTFNLNGTTDFLDYDLPLLSSPNQLTFGGWIKPSQLRDNTILINNGQSFSIILGKSGNGHCVISTSNNPWYSPGTVASWSSSVIKNDIFQHLVCVYDGTNLQVYLNGQIIAKSSNISGSVSIGPTRTIIARAVSATTTSFNGQIKGFIVKTEPYTQQNIELLMQQTQPSQIPGDLNLDGHVNIFDFNLLVTKFGNPYTIFDFNDIVANYGK